MPGRADYRETQDDETRKTKLINTMAALARWHTSAATFQSIERRRPAPGIDIRRKRYQELRQGGLEVLRRSVAENQNSLPANIVATANELLRQFPLSADLSGELQAACQIPVSLQPCIRDIWHDHVLFTGDHVSGIVDFGALRMAAVVGDVARLLGSLAIDDHQLWEWGLQAYREAQPQGDKHADDTQRQFVRTWDAANVALSGLQWVQWLFVEGRFFSAYATVQQRMDEHLMRLQHRNRYGFS
jgi:homoserine kinase type II